MRYFVTCLINGREKGIPARKKLKIVLEGMSGSISVADLCRKYDFKPARFYYWKDQLLNSAPEIFENRGRKEDRDSRILEKERENSRLKDVIAGITAENLEIKKKDWRTLAEEGTEMRSLFFYLHRTVKRTVKRPALGIVKVLVLCTDVIFTTAGWKIQSPCSRGRGV